jgi:hypothetical protein
VWTRHKIAAGGGFAWWYGFVLAFSMVAWLAVCIGSAEHEAGRGGRGSPRRARQLEARA